MATITSQGIGSNLDVSGIISKLMDVEKQPLTALEKKEASYQAKISAFGSLKSSLSTLQNAVAGMVLDEGDDPVDFYSTYKGSLSDEAVAAVTAGQGTIPGKHSLEVSKLAQGHRIISSAGAAIGTGELTLQLGSEDGSTTTQTTKVTISSTNLNDIKDAINKANAGVTAAVVNGSAGPQLILTSEKTGENQFIKLSGVSGLAYTPGAASPNFTQEQAAQNASLKLNGITIESESSRLENVIDGVTLELKKETSGTPATLTLSRDTSGLGKLLDKMVTAYNDYLKQAKELGNYNPETGESGTLVSDGTLRSATTRLRMALGQTVSGSTLRTLSDIGISMQKDGTLSLDSSKLEALVQKDFAGVAKVASAVGKSLETSIQGLIGTEGSIVTKTASIESMVKGLEARKTILNARLEKIEANYTKQYTSLDSLISSLMQTSTYLEQQLASLPGAASSKN